jgi:hypothetical protein
MALIIGLSILVVSLIGYLIIGYYIVKYSSVPDDIVSWFHLHVVNYIRNGGDLSSDHVLRFIDGRNLLLSPILLDFLVASLNVSPWITTLFMGIVYVILVFITGYYVSKNVYVAGFSAALFSITPAFTYWFKYNIFGAYVSQALWLLPVLLLGYGFRRNNLWLQLLGSIIFGILWLAWPGSWVFLIAYSIYLSALIYRGVIDKLSIITGLFLVVFTLPLNIVFNLYYITVYHVFSYVLLVSNIILGYIEYIVIKRSGIYARFAWRFLGSILGYGVGFATAFSLIDLVSRLGVYEDYYHLYNPIYDYGVVGILSVIAIIAVVRSRLLVDLRNRFVSFVLLTGFIIGLITGYFDPTLAVFAASSVVVFISIGLMGLVRFLIGYSSGWYRLIYSVIAVWIIIGSIMGNAIPSYAYSAIPPSIYYGDFTYELLHNKSISESPFLEAFHYIINNTDANKSILVISYWGYSYWIVGYIGERAHTLADFKGTTIGQRIISWIMTSDETTAYQIIRSIIGNRSNIDVYILVSDVVSVETAGGRYALRNAHLGRPIIIGGVGQEESHFQPIGDIARIPMYLTYVNKSIQSYIDYTLAKYYFEIPLAWRDNAKNMLLVKLIIDSLRWESLNPVNDVLQSYTIRGVSSPRLFKHITTIMVPLYKVTTPAATYEVTYMVGVYKMKTNIE